MYVYQPYPRWKYHPDGRAQLVEDEAAEKALGPDWADSPSAFAEADPAPPQPAPPAEEMPRPGLRCDAGEMLPPAGDSKPAKRNAPRRTAKKSTPRKTAGKGKAG